MAKVLNKADVIADVEAYLAAGRKVTVVAGKRKCPKALSLNKLSASGKQKRFV